MKQIKKIIFIITIFCAGFACKSSRVIHGTQEYISFKPLDSMRYKYLHYNLTGNNFIYEYNLGRYQHIENVYKLFPDDVDNENFEVTSKQKVNDSNGLRIRVTTDIKGDYLNQYLIEIINSDKLNISFHNVYADTIIKKNIVNALRIKVTLPIRFSKGIGTQLPTFQTITTRSIIVDSLADEISIHVPISFSTFFYQYQKEIVLEDIGKYWKVNGNKIPMRNEDF